MVPCNYNNGTPVRTRHHREWDRQVRRISKGLTILPPSKGQWIDVDSEGEEKLYEDRVIPVNIIATLEEMKVIADLTIRHYDQIAVLYYMISDSPIIQYKR